MDQAAEAWLLGDDLAEFRALESMHESDGWLLFSRDLADQIRVLRESVLEAPDWDTVQRIRMKADALEEVLEHPRYTAARKEMLLEQRRMDAEDGELPRVE